MLTLWRRSYLVTSWEDGWYIFWYQWKRRHNSNALVLNARVGYREFCIYPLHGRPFADKASNWQSNRLGRYVTMYSPIVRSVVLERRNRTIAELFGNVSIYNAARLRLFPHTAEPSKKRFFFYTCKYLPDVTVAISTRTAISTAIVLQVCSILLPIIPTKTDKNTHNIQLLAVQW